MNFALIGAAGFVAPRHIKAIHDTRNTLVAAVDPHDAVGILDRFSYDLSFFTEIERFDRHLEKLRRGPAERRVHYVSICSPNYLHDAHMRLALRVGADAICEKPLVINPWNLDPLVDLEAETSKRIYTVLQLRHHPKLLDAREALGPAPGRPRRRVTLTYITPRGRWYDVSWKGSEERSGGVVTNIGIHLFDLLLWLFGPSEAVELHARDARRASGTLTCEGADISWYLSTDPADLPVHADGTRPVSHRAIDVDGTALEFSDGFGDLHTRCYEEILAGRGPRIADARPSIELVHTIRHAPIVEGSGPRHPWLTTAAGGRA